MCKLCCGRDGTGKHLVAWNVYRASEQGGICSPRREGTPASLRSSQLKGRSQSAARLEDRQAGPKESGRVRAPKAEPIKQDDTILVWKAQ